MGNFMDSEMGRTCDEVSREYQKSENTDRQSFSMGSTDSTVGENSQSKKS